MDSMPFGQVLREYRIARGLSQESLAERAAMSVNGISALERGASQAPQRKTLDLLMQALRLDAEQARVLEAAAARPSRPRRAPNRSAGEDLPHAPTPFFGRTEAVATVARLVDVRPLVTLTGPGGIGKTRLALKVAEQPAQRFHGVLFVDLAPLRDPESVLLAIGAHFGVKASGEEPALMTLAKALCSTHALLIVDNCEHVVSAVASAVQAFIRACPGIRIIATSRQPLDVPGEQIFRVPPLEVDAAVELFTERAKRADASFTLSERDKDAAARVVTRLDGIALAIELAAARMNVLSLAQLEQNLCERLEILSGGSSMSVARQQTMRATMDWSYELLEARERELFRRLWIFPSDFSLDAAVDICTGERSGKWQVFEALASLIDRSLLNRSGESGAQRYHLLETTRAYAAEQLTGRDEIESLHRSHAGYYGKLAESAAAALSAAESTTEWARALEPDLENFRSALNWNIRDDAASAARLLFDLQELWIVEGLAAEAARKSTELLQMHPELPNPLRAALWLTIARMRQELFVHPGGTLDAACNARRLYENSDDRRGLALAIRQQAAAHMRLGAYAEARDEFARSLEIYKDLGDQRMAARALGYLASLLQIEGDYSGARALLLEVLRTARSTGDDRMIPTVCMNLAETEFALGDYAAAAERARENLSNEILLKSCDMTATQEANLSAYLLAMGRTEEARDMAMASMRNAAGSFIAVPLQHFAASVAQTQPELAAKVLGYVDEAFAAAAFSRENTERFTYNHVTNLLREALEADALETYLRIGAAMSESQIVDLVRQAFRVAS